MEKMQNPILVGYDVISVSGGYNNAFCDIWLRRGEKPGDADQWAYVPPGTGPDEQKTWTCEEPRWLTYSQLYNYMDPGHTAVRLWHIDEFLVGSDGHAYLAAVWPKRELVTYASKHVRAGWNLPFQTADDARRLVEAHRAILAERVRENERIEARRSPEERRARAAIKDFTPRSGNQVLAETILRAVARFDATVYFFTGGDDSEPEGAIVEAPAASDRNRLYFEITEATSLVNWKESERGRYCRTTGGGYNSTQTFRLNEAGEVV